LRHAFADELEQLRLQVELLGVRADQTLERMRIVLQTGDLGIARRMVDDDDPIDAMVVSLTERSYDLLRRESPVASDLRLVVSVLRVVGELERIGDLALRVAKRAPEHDLLVRNRDTFDVLLSMADEAIELYRTTLRAWSIRDLALASELASRSAIMDAAFERLMIDILGTRGPDAVPVAVTTVTVGRAIERIADHCLVIAKRVEYLLTGNPDHLASEVR